MNKINRSKVKRARVAAGGRRGDTGEDRRLQTVRRLGALGKNNVKRSQDALGLLCT